jgi:hypothetical protein
MTTFAFSCVVGKDPILIAQAFIWVNCLKRIQHIDPAYIFVHTTVDHPEFCGWFDVAEAAVVIAREKRPDWTFQVMQAEDRIPDGNNEYQQICLTSATCRSAASPLYGFLGGTRRT